MNWTEPAVIVALFNTFFSLMGIVILAPFIKQFTKRITLLLPEKKSAITKHLDSSIIPIPAVATETAMRALKEAGIQTLTATSGKLESLSDGLPLTDSAIIGFDEDLRRIQHEIEEIKNFVVAIRTDSQESTDRYISLLHALDHMQRMNRLVVNNLSEVKLTNPLERIYPVVFQLGELIMESIEGLEEDNLGSVVEKLTIFSGELAEFRRKERAGIFEVTAKGEVHVVEAFQYVRLVLVVDGISHHLWRMMHHMSEEDSSDQTKNRSE